MSIFERAAKSKVRFESKRGLLTVEDLYDLTLQGLDAIAKDINRQLKADSEESFISVKSKSSSLLELKLDILKHIIADKLALQEANKKRNETLARNKKIEEIIAKKQDQALENLSLEELQKQLESVEV